MALAAMYQRIPYSILSEVNKKKPQSYAILKLPPSQSDVNYSEWERSNPATTTTFDDAKRKSKHTRAIQQSGPDFRDVAFAKWATVTFPKDIDFESALERIEQSNSREPRVLKYKLMFADGCHILLSRSNWEDPSTLYCIEAYNPNGAFDKMTKERKEGWDQTEGKKRQKFLVSEKGHLKTRPRDEVGSPKKTSFPTEAVEVGKAGFSFTPVSYISHEVRPNVSFPGVRPGLKETNKAAYHFLPKSP
jgi:hypothetical protein